MEYRVLGQVAALRGGAPVRVKPKVLELLAVLLVAPGHRVSHAGIMRYMWPGEESKPARIRQYVHQLRKSLPEVAERNGRNDPGFCWIEVDPGHVDHLRFQSLRRIAEAAGSGPARLDALRSALDEWRGEPLEDLPGEAFARSRAGLLNEFRQATVDCAKAELECGQKLAALERISAARARWPKDETLLQLQVGALRSLNRQEEIEPELFRWERLTGRSAAPLLLAHRTDGRSGPADSRSPQSPPPPPRQLPALSSAPVGRQRQLARLTETLLGRSVGRSRIAVLTGMGGVGKSVLAVRGATEVARHFPDGVLHIELRGSSPGEPERHGLILARLLNDLGVRAETPTLDGMVSAYRTALADRAVLLVIDDARDDDHVRRLLPGPGPSAALITSRRQLHGLAIREGAELIEVDPLDRGEATELLRTQLGEERMRTTVPFIDDLVEYCGGIPLALSITAARIASRPLQALPGLVRELRQERTRLSSFDLGSADLSVRSSLKTTVEHLTVPAAELLWQLAVHPGPTISWLALRAFAPDDTVGVTHAIDDLTRSSLVTEPIFERYSLHDLVRVFAGELADERSEADRARVRERVLRFLLHNAWACDRKLDPDRRLPIGECHDIKVVAPARAVDAMSWFEAEYPTMTAAVRMADDRGLDRYTWLLAMTMVTFQWRSGRYLDALTYLSKARDAAMREAGPADVAMVHRMLAGTYRGLGNLPRATGELRRAVRVSEDGGDARGAAQGRCVLGVLLREAGAPGEATEHFDVALSVFEKFGDALGRGAALNGLASAAYDLGRHKESVELCLRSLTLLDATEDVNGRAHALFTLGRTRLALGDHEAAVEGLEKAGLLYRSLTYASREARVLVWLADALRAMGQPLEAKQALGRVTNLLEDQGEADHDAAVQRLRSLP
ncbi:AfsR/SARP family transcriptional regulator [Streptomyces johnsoniae]|uniref:Tetratricopeptide repeat protein n=1 Tax=Streptomyces johnsoniae TaxID=3075532 RepID=A0ABU2SH01_9ACTN|nr:tetratricopeptide repeat protein [Streptomyces sp. DSM 41886]MDT0447045.1 tetratricopeptide repeat protein [Streptomyces sp. DSM 41886]